MHEHISRLDTNTNDPGQPPNHGVGPGLRLLLQSFLTSVLDLPDLADNKAQPRHVTLQLGQGVWRQRHALRSVHGCQTFGRLAQGWFEVANAQPGQGGLYPVHNPRAFSHQAFALPVRPLGVLFGKRWHARHAAMAPFPTQPPQEPPLEQFGVQPVGLCPAMFPRTAKLEGWITCASTPRASSQRASQKPSRPASKASAIRVTSLPALTASSRQ